MTVSELHKSVPREAGCLRTRPLRRSRSGNPDTIINFGNNDSYNHVTATTANYGSSNRSRDKVLLMISIIKISV